MSAESIVAALTAQSSLTATFGDRIALHQLPPDTDITKACLVYDVTYDEPTPNVNFRDGKSRSAARVRFSVMGKTPTAVLAAHLSLRTVLDFTYGNTWGGHRVVMLRKVLSGVLGRDNAAGVWWRPDDYALAYYD